MNGTEDLRRGPARPAARLGQPSPNRNKSDQTGQRHCPTDFLLLLRQQAQHIIFGTLFIKEIGTPSATRSGPNNDLLLGNG